jgi:hypothetical protein
MKYMYLNPDLVIPTGQSERQTTLTGPWFDERRERSVTADFLFV